ncbi:ligand-binding sensor domain-containing protein [Catalinimonas alkaloidigena]|uniref:type IX secretion system anionic LPS delivery protein PorZ n=1 Tax=Catalinimonas alkaloidigena TaxID=1075417 RepID=UPI0024068B17|nr:two-component regulator propeller domain-containing protein [Catalinimonas alkaloidigena]MDF9801075.1 ligand-binding sensor domain-containing protein [Catalinimonas alkaloidigena]
MGKVKGRARWVLTTGALISFILCFAHSLFAQREIPIGTWRTHFSYQQSKLVCLAKNKVYSATQNGLFFYDHQTSSLNVLSKLDGLSDAGLTAMDYQEAGDLLILAYKSNRVDVLSPEGIASFSLLQESVGNEQINAVLLNDHIAYLATSLGVRVLEIDTGEEELNIGIRESYTRLSSVGETLPVYDVTVLGDSIFLATDEGVIANSLDINVNRQDFASWERLDVSENLPVSYVEQDGKNILAAVDGEGIYALIDGNWMLTEIVVEGSFSSFNASSGQLVAVADGQVYILGETLSTVITSNPSEAVIDTEGILWVADATDGLIKIDQTGQEQLLPSGPLSDDVYSLHYANGSMILLLDSREAGFSIFEEGKWHNYPPAIIAENLSQLSPPPLVDVDYLPAEQSYYFASLGNGVIRWDGENSFSSITSTSEESSLANDVVSSVLVQNTQLWLSNYDVLPSVHLYNSDEGSWQSFAPNGLAGQFPVDMVLAYDDMPWLLSSRQGAGAHTGSELVVFDAANSTSLQIRANVAVADLPGNEFTDIAVDREGQIWLAGNEGVTYFPTPADIFSFPTAIKPVFENQFLLFGEYITSIAVDGGNRKWIGTRDGAWLFNETGEELVHHFVSENSPLPSDNVLDISVNDGSGEVFFLTEQGVVSYRGSSTQGEETQQTVKIFPNPVPATFDGQVGIEGLVTDANVKITTISGTLVREVEAEGGMAVWDVKDYSGSRVGTGVYLLFTASEDGSQTFIAKVAVIN